MSAANSGSHANPPKPSLLVQGTRLDGRLVDIRVAGQRILDIRAHDVRAHDVRAHEALTQETQVHQPETRTPNPATPRILNGRGTAVLPGLMNAHTHSAMVILRSYADDMPLMPWLEEKIWPIEARLVEEDIYWAARLACIEMIRSGTTFFSDMYWHLPATARAARDSGMRALLAGAIIDRGDASAAEAQREAILTDHAYVAVMACDRVRYALGPHAVYTVGRDSLVWVAEQSERLGLPVHLHLSETETELALCQDAQGLRPPAWLDSLGLLGRRTFAAHCVHLNEAEIALLAERGVHPIHNPISNLKLASGGPMPYAAMRAAGLRPLIGTDGCASNNNLDLLEELKFAALLAKHASGDPTVLPAEEALAMATIDAARAYDLDCGAIAPGKLADFFLVDLSHPMMFPGHNLAADLVYSAQGRAVVATVCDGQVLMEAGRVADEAEIRAEVAQRWNRIAGRA
jgi:5-methylthioadenosine/S-adenosylhomocysteine deaminase